MKRSVCPLFLSFCLLFFIFSIGVSVEAQGDVSSQDQYICAIYLSGIGCSNCAKADPALFGEILPQNPKLIVFKYEVYKQRKINKEIKDK